EGGAGACASQNVPRGTFSAVFAAEPPSPNPLPLCGCAAGGEGHFAQSTPLRARGILRGDSEPGPMRRLTLALLSASYVCFGLIVGLTIWRNGGGWGAGAAALMGGLALAFTLHGLIARALETTALKTEVEAVREAHRILIDQMERLDGRLAEVAKAVDFD